MFDERSASDSLTSFAKRLEMAPSTIQTILKNREHIETSSVTISCKRKKVKCSKYEDIETILMEWIQDARHANIPLNGPIVQAKAKEIAQLLGVEFSASNGWLDRFKKRNGLVYKQICGESEAVDLENVNSWRTNILSQYLRKYEPKDVFNADEFGLFFKLMPNKTITTLKGEKCHGGKLSKERLTVLVGSNADGSEKLDLLVIGKSKTPHCLRRVPKSKFPCAYSDQNKAWMTSQRFEKWLKALDRKMEKQKRKIVLFIDNCPAHPKNVVLKNVEVVFLPKNATSVCQPMDQGIIKVMKQHYRHRLVQRYIAEMESPDLVKKVTILDAMNYIKSSWLAVDPRTILNCFRKAGFSNVSIF